MRRYVLYLLFLFIPLSPHLLYSKDDLEEGSKIKLQEVEITGEDRTKFKLDDREFIDEGEEIEVEGGVVEEKGEVELKESGPERLYLSSEKGLPFPEEEEVEVRLEEMRKESMLRFSYGMLDTLKYQYKYIHETERFNILVSLDRDSSDGFKTTEPFSFFDEVSKDDISLRASLIKEDLIFSGSAEFFRKDATLPFKIKDIERMEEKERVEEKSDNINVALGVKGLFKNDLGLNAKVLWSDMGIEHCGVDETRNGFFGLDCRISTYIKQMFRALFRGYFQTEAIREKDGESLHSLFYTASCETKFPVSNVDLKVRLSLEGFRNEDEGANLFIGGSVLSTLPIKKNLQLTGSYERGLYPPDFSDLYVRNNYIMVERSLRPEELSHHVRLGLNYLLPPLGSVNTTLKTTLFFKDYRHMIIWDEDDENEYLYKPQNTHANAWGFDTLLKCTFTKHVFQTLRLTYHNWSKRIPLEPEYQLELGLRYYASPMEVDLKGVYVSQRYSSLSSSERDLPGFFVIDSTAKYEVARDLSVFVSCKNLLDERGAYKRKGYPISGRVVEGGLTIKF